MKKQKYTEVWGDTVLLLHLFYACTIGIILTMSFFLVGRHIFMNMNIEAGLAQGYSLMCGVLGAIVAGIINATFIKPKRKIEEKLEAENLDKIFELAGIDREEEIAALAKLDQNMIKEMESLELYSLLALIPADSPNYKPEYRILAGQTEVTR